MKTFHNSRLRTVLAMMMALAFTWPVRKYSLSDRALRARTSRFRSWTVKPGGACLWSSFARSMTFAISRTATASSHFMSRA